MKTIIIDGIEYELKPIKKDVEVVGTEKTENSVENDYLGGVEGVAVPKVSDYRERYKQHRLRASDTRTVANPVPLPRMDTEMDKFGDLVVGPGLEQEI